MNEKLLDITAKDRVKLNARLFYNSDKPKGVLIVCHGFGEHIDRYRQFAEYFCAAEYACFVFDQRGHGSRCDKKSFGIIPAYDTFLDDVGVVKREVMAMFPDVPLFLFGHSMGGNIAVNYLLRKGEQAFRGAIIETPWFRLLRPVPKPLDGLARVLGSVSRKWAITNKLNSDHKSSDNNKDLEIDHDEFGHNRISYRMYTGVSDAGEYAIESARRLRLPILLISAGEDQTVCSKAIKEFARNAGTNVILKSYDEACHSVHNDKNKDTYLKDMIEYLDSINTLSQKR